MTIQHRTVKRTISLEEFKKFHEIEQEPFESFRQNAKGANFSLLFGMVAVSFARTSIIPNWTDEQIEQFIADNDLYDDDAKFKIASSNAFKSLPPEQWGYITVADYIRTHFFKSYPGLMERIEEYRKFATENGYVRSIHGAIRRFPHLLMSGADDDRKELAGYLNMAVNSTIQNDEACRVMSCITEFVNWRNANHIKSYIYGTVHDSVDFVIFDNEVDVVVPKIHEIFEKMEPWQKQVPLTVELKLADLTRGEHYKGGLKEKAFLKRRASEQNHTK